jgi:hypothetical protein
MPSDEFLATRLVPTSATHRTRFRTLVAVNALTIHHARSRGETQHIRDEASALPECC